MKLTNNKQRENSSQQMKTFTLTFELVAAVTVEQEEDWLNDPAIIKIIPISEHLSKK